MNLENMITIYIQEGNCTKIIKNVILDSVCYDDLARAISFDFYFYNSKKDKMVTISHIVRMERFGIFYFKNQNNYE